MGTKRVKLSRVSDELAACDIWLSTTERKNVITVRLVLCPRKFSVTVILHLAMSPKFGDRVDCRLCPQKFSWTVILHLAMSPKFWTVEAWICPEK